MKRTPKSKVAPASVNAAEAADLQKTMQANQVKDGPAAPPVAEPAKPDPKKDKKPKPQRVEQIMVRHDFTVPELAQLGGSLADKSRVLADLEGEAKACARQYKDKVGTIQTEIDSTVNKIKEGFEMVAVDAIAMVQIDRKAKTATKAYYRKDTGAFIKLEDLISNTELPLFNVLPEGRDLSRPLDKKLLEQAV